MTLDQAVETLVAEFGQLDTTQTTSESSEICSGGQPQDVDGEAATPALCATQALAVTLWLVAMQEFLRDKKPTSWWLVDGPHLDKFFITIMDGNKAHRTASDRYAVTAKVGLALPPVEEPKSES